MTRRQLERFRRYVEKTDGCWLWTGYVTNVGYGRLNLHRQPTYAHRAMWEHKRGPIPDGMEIHHICGVKTCVNPQHMTLVTREEHMGL